MPIAEVAPPPLCIHLLGPLEVLLNGRPLPRLRSRKGHWILALLLLRHDREVERGWLAGTLWPESPATQALANLRNSLRDLRHALGAGAGRILSPSIRTLSLDLSDASIDLLAFDTAIERGDTAALKEAVSLYRGPLLEGCVEEWVLAEREGREQAYLAALETLAAHAREQGDAAAVERHLRQIVNVDPLLEGAHRELMQVLAEQGNPAEAVSVYRDLRERLHAEMSTEPDAETTDLLQRLRLEARTRAARASSPLVKGEREPAPCLPLPLDRLFGREDEIASLSTLLLAEGTRLVTLTGCGGVGKTRLALELVEQMLQARPAAHSGTSLYPWYVTLSDLPSEADRDSNSPAPGILEAIRDAVRLPRVREIEPLEQLAEALSRRPSLLVLDNFEHLLPDGAARVQALLTRVPTLRCLVTSRHRLDLPGERELPVSPLPTPSAALGSWLLALGWGQNETEGGDASSLPPPRAKSQEPRAILSCPSVQLFVDRAQSVRPDFQVTASNAAAVAELCDRLEGIPLAIELAATRVQVLSPAQILPRLKERLDLAARQHGVTARHRSLRATLDWSYQLLTPELQAAFARLSVFRGGFTLEAAEALWFDRGAEPWPSQTGGAATIPALGALHSMPNALDTIEQLREWSLIVVEDTGAECRYRLLETLREYAEERLRDAGQTEAASRRHQEYFTGVAEQAEAELKGPAQREWLGRLERDRENLRVAITSLLESGGEAAAERLLGARTWFLTWFWWGLGYGREGHLWLTDRLATLRGGRASSVEARLRRARALSGAGFLLAFCEADFALARTVLEESLAILRRLGGEREIANTLARLAYAVCPIEGEARGQSLYEESLAHYRRHGDCRGAAEALMGLGSVAFRQGEYSRARSLLTEGLTLYQDLGDRYHAAGVLSVLGLVAWHDGDLDEARSRLEASLQIGRWFGNEAMIASDLGNLGLVAQDQGDTGAARRLHEETLAVMRRFGNKHGVACALNDLGNVALAEGELAVASRLHEESLSMRQAMQNNRDIAASLSNLGNVLLAQGEPTRAEERFRESLALRQEQGDRRGIAGSLEGLAKAAALSARSPRAAALFGAAAALREVIGAPLPPSARAEHKRALAGVRTALGDDRFAAEWVRGRVLTIEDAMREALFTRIERE